MMTNLKMRGLSLMFALGVSAGCGYREQVDISELGQQIGDVMASIDEFDGATLPVALQESSRRTYSRLAPGELRDSPLDWLIPKASAAVCSSVYFSNCENNQKIRSFLDCTLGSLSFRGAVTLKWQDAAPDNNCAMALVNHFVTRDPNFEVRGRRGAVLSVEKSGTTGQKVTKTTSGFEFTSDGIRRRFTGDGSVSFDFTTRTTSAISISGSSRANRVLNGGALQVTNNGSGVVCTYSPSNVKWIAGCNCPSSGSWSGSCSDGKTSKLQIEGCGSGTLTLGDESESFSFDRCSQT